MCTGLLFIKPSKQLLISSPVELPLPLATLPGTSPMYQHIISRENYFLDNSHMP